MRLGGIRICSPSACVDEMRLWLGLAQTTRSMFLSALLFILGSGLFMADRSWTFDTPWIVVAIVATVVIGILGVAVVGRGFGAMGRAASSSAGSVSAELGRIVRRPTLWVTAAALNGMALGVLWLMVNKPGWTQSIAVVAALGLVGGIARFAALRPRTRTS